MALLLIWIKDHCQFNSSGSLIQDICRDISMTFLFKMKNYNTQPVTYETDFIKFEKRRYLTSNLWHGILFNHKGAPKALQ